VSGPAGNALQLQRTNYFVVGLVRLNQTNLYALFDCLHAFIHRRIDLECIMTSLGDARGEFWS
jgi:hypothetical protein